MPTVGFTPVITTGAIILVTGANGYIGAQVAENLLSLGYRVRGSVRNLDKCKTLQEQFDKKHGAGMFELVKVDRINDEGAFDEAAKGTPYNDLGQKLCWKPLSNTAHCLLRCLRHRSHCC